MDVSTSLQQGIGGVGEMGTVRREKERGGRREGKQDYEIVIIAYTNEKLITPQLA